MFIAESPAEKIVNGLNHKIIFNLAYDIPDHLTTFRGRGGLEDDT